jgi:hypothetical protein
MGPTRQVDAHEPRHAARHQRRKTVTISPAIVIVVGAGGSAQILCAIDWAARETPARKRPSPIVHTFL